MYSDLHIPCSRPPRVGPSVNDDNAAGGSSSRAARPAITTLPRTAASVSGTSRLIARSNALRAKRNTEMWYSSDAAVRPSGKAHEGPMQTRLVSSLSPTTPGLLLSETEEVVEQLPHEGTQEVLGGRHGEAAYGARGRPIPVSRNRLENKSLRSRGAAPDRAIYDTHPEHDRREHETRERLRVQAELEPEKRARTAEYVQALLESRLRDEAAAHEHARSTRPTGELKVREGAEAAARERDRAQEEGHPWLEEQSGPDTDKTIKHGILGSIVTFGAGLDVCGLTTGLESCIVRVRGLPEDALEREIYALFTQQGIDIGRLCLLRNRVDHDGTRDVKMAMDAESGHAISIGLDKLEFRDRFVFFDVYPYVVAERKNTTKDKNVEALQVSCQTVAASYIATYDSQAIANSRIQELNGTMFSGRRLRVQAYAAPGHAICIGYASIEIDNLHPSVTYEQVSVLAGFEALTVRALKGTHPTAALLEVVRAEVLESGCSPSDIISLKLRSEASDALDGLVRLRVRFRSWDQAKVVHDFLNGRELPLMNVTFRTNLSPHFSYSITIPLQQYEVQYRQWIALRNSVQAGVSSECNLTDFEDIEPPAVRLCVSGSNEKAVGALKVRVERLATGEKLDGWHPRLKHDYSDAFVARVLEESGALVCADCKNCQLLAYGSPDAILRARGMVEIELARLADLDFTADVPLTSMQYLLAQGLSGLRELLGDDNIRFDPIARSITISRGGHEARSVVSYILEYCAARRLDTAHQASNTHGLCPICFDSVSIPVRLGCGHTYCLMCLRHLITSAADSGIHPLVCLGGETRCNVAIPIPFIERYVPQHLLVRLLETTFRTYVSQHPQELRYCRTPDCEQIYRCAPQGGSRPIPVQCPACFSVVCPRCHSDAHDGSTCEGVRFLDSSADQERLLNGWIASQRGRVKKCPQCRVPIEKTEGCNHVKCRCGVDVCWRCLGIFPADAIYGHMNMAHGGHSGQEDNVVDIPLDHDEQEDLLPRPRGLFGTGPLRFMGAQNGVMPFRQVAQRARDNILHIPAGLGQRRGQDQGQCVVM